MATFRVGVGSFNIKDGAVGFGTEIDGLGNLRVKGVTKTTGSIVSGASTLTRYSGFAADNINQLENITLTSEVGTIGDIVVGVGTSVIISSGSTVTVGTVESVSIGTHFSPPKGGIEERGQDFVEGMMRFNTDLNTMEFYNGNEWRQFNYISDIQNSPGSRGRGLFAGGRTPSFPPSIEFIEIASLGNGQNFGDLTVARESSTNGVASHVRGLFGGGYHPGAGDDEIDYVTMASEGNAIDFGNLSAERYSPGGGSSSTRGIFGGGSPSVNIIEYVEISTLGDAVDFGDLVTARRYPFGTSSPVRVVFAGGTTASSPYPPLNVMDFITTSSKGNATTFGVLSAAVQFATGCSNSVRGLYHLGSSIWSPVWNSLNQVDTITLASTGNATNFGELTDPRHYTGGVSNNVRGVFGGGFTGPSTTRINTIDFVLIASQGNGQDFGDLSEPRTAPGTVCDSHGGLGGY